MAPAERQLSFAEHIRELRGRVMWSLAFVVIGAGVGYALHDTLLAILQQPLHEKLYYTTPTGAFSFIIKICTVFGFLVALPVAIYHIFAFFGPLIKARTKKQFISYVLASFLLASAGIAFAYFISLPAALNFLVNFGSDKGSMAALITANEYFNFVLAYIAGYAVLFQLPLIMAFINRVKPLPPKKMLSGTRYVILGSFIVAAIITPTPDPFNQFIMAGPIILLYFASIVMIMFINMRARRRLRKAGEVVPHIEPRTIEAILDSLPTQPKPASDIPLFAPQIIPEPAPISPVPAKPAAIKRQQPRLVSDMVAQPAKRPAMNSTQRRVIRQIQAQPRPMNLNPNIRVISDFIPATNRLST